MNCFNRDRDGKCEAFTKSECREDCPARIKTAQDKVRLLQSIINYSHSRSDQLDLEKELRDVEAYLEAEGKGQYEDWMACYLDDTHRGEKGGASESDSNRKTGLKQLMKDNRPVGVKPTRAQLEAAKDATVRWEEENGKLERLGRSAVSHNHIDSYTNLPICFIENHPGTCKGQITASGAVPKTCKICEYLEK